MVFKWIVLLVIGLARRAYCTYQCTMESFEVTCTSISSNELSENVTVTLNKPDIISINIINGHIPTVSPAIFKDFNTLQYLYITNSGVANIEDNSFSQNVDLKHLYLNNNSLKEFNTKSLPLENSQLHTIDLSYNLLETLEGFNVSNFFQLRLLNVANNFLTYLPENILNKLKEENQFFLISDNNPWNCSHSNWSEYLTESLIKAFCVNKTFNYQPVRSILSSTVSTTSVVTPNTTSISHTNTTNAIQATEDLFSTSISRTESTTDADTSHRTPFKRYLKVENVEDGNYSEASTVSQNDDGSPATHLTQCEKPDCMKCSSQYCLMWLFGGIWIGIILGNVLKIKTLVCGKPVIYTDRYTQCEQSLSDQYMISGFHLDFNNQRRAFLVPAKVSTENTNVKLREKSDISNSS